MYKVIYQLSIKFWPLFEEPKSISLFLGNGWYWSVQHMDWHSLKLLELSIAWFDVKHRISALLKVGSPISGCISSLSLLTSSVTGSILSCLWSSRIIYGWTLTLVSFLMTKHEASLPVSFPYLFCQNFRLVLISEPAGRMQDHSW